MNLLLKEGFNQNIIILKPKPVRQDKLFVQVCSIEESMQKFQIMVIRVMYLTSCVIKIEKNPKTYKASTVNPKI